MTSGSKDRSADNRRIARNTMMLYFRMLLLMFVSLYTSRINLNALGVDNFGIYSVVGGLVGMFWIVSTALVSSINRYITFELGTGNQERLNRIFSTAKGFQYVIVGVVIILAETIGLWFLNNKMVIPADRLVAANWVYQFSVLSFCLDLLVIPYTADIIAHEKMSAFAYISIISAVGKLIVAWTILIAPIDRLIWFGALILVNSTIIRFIYIYYCKKHFEECRSPFVFDKSIWKEMFGFAGWSFIGTIAAILRDYGGNILINLFFGPAVNAARGIAGQVNGAVAGFVDNFQTAIKPQITKSYASGDLSYMYNLIYLGSRFSFYILFILALPILCSTHYVLELWLDEVPEYTVLFVQLILILTMHETLSGSLITAMLATGNIRNFQIIVGGLNLMNLPLSYLCLKLGWIPQSVVIVAIFVSICCTIARIILVRETTGMPVRAFVMHVYMNIFMISGVACVVPIIVRPHIEENFLGFVIESLIAVLCSTLSILYVGCNRKERAFVFSKARMMINRVLHH